MMHKHPNGPSVETLRDFAKFQHDYVFKNIVAADRKAAAIFAIASALLGYVATNYKYVEWMSIPPWEGEWYPREYLSALASVMLIGSGWWALRVIWPNLNGDAKGLIYWRSVAGFDSANAYYDVIAHKSDSQLAAEVARHIYEISVVCKLKYERLRVALWLGVIGLLSLLIAFALITGAWG